MTMSLFSRPITTASPFLRPLALAALLGTSMLGGSLTIAAAEPGTYVQSAQVVTPAGKAATDMKGETVEARITKLHADLKITAAEQSKWDGVAQAMRDNAANMEKLVATKRKVAPESLTAVDDLLNYQEFAEAHLAGLKHLTSAFKSLYGAMPDDQKKNADKVFESFGHTAPAKS
jgi:membrane-bound ClpP family serine protease